MRKIRGYWVASGLRNVCFEANEQEVKQILIKKYFHRKPTMKQMYDFIDKFIVYNVHLEYCKSKNVDYAEKGKEWKLSEFPF